jgi:hypothetical protein
MLSNGAHASPLAACRDVLVAILLRVLGHLCCRAMQDLHASCTQRRMSSVVQNETFMTWATQLKYEVCSCTSVHMHLRFLFSCSAATLTKV